MILEDLEFMNQESEGSGIRQFSQHVTMRRIYSHDNYFQGLWLDNSHVLLEGSRFENNASQGSGSGCMGDWRPEATRSIGRSDIHLWRVPEGTPR